ncbi:MAG: virulence protein RhuM/Fic/DOC family protein [Akkermansia sp.]|nr:virulence protein RhuM/Fic/DOC family protein [Akkermansia sp.]
MKADIPQEPESEILLYTTPDGEVQLDIRLQDETLWMTQQMMSELFQTTVQNIIMHVGNIYQELELQREGTCKEFLQVRREGNRQVSRPVRFYNLDMILSVGYRVNTRRGTQFRIWATRRLREYLLRGYVVHERRLQQLGQVVRLMRRAADRSDARQVLDVIEHYSTGLNLLDAYDHQCLTRPEGRSDCYVLSYDECRRLIDSMSFGAESDLFGREKDDSFRGSLGNIYQSFGGVDIYPTMEEKAARLLYFAVKNHGFYDGNKRIAAAVFLYFLDCNNALFIDGEKRLADATLVALVILIAESRPDEMETIISVILNCMQP